MTREHKISEGKKGREGEKRRQEQSKKDVRIAAEKNRQRNQGERKQTNSSQKPMLSNISMWSLFQGWKRGSLSCNSL